MSHVPFNHRVAVYIGLLFSMSEMSNVNGHKFLRSLSCWLRDHGHWSWSHCSGNKSQEFFQSVSQWPIELSGTDKSQLGQRKYPCFSDYSKLAPFCFAYFAWRSKLGSWKLSYFPSHGPRVLLRPRYYDPTLGIPMFSSVI